MTIEYTGDDGKTEFLCRLEDIVAFYHTAERANNVIQRVPATYTIIVGKQATSWVEVSEGCYNFVKEKWVDFAN